MCIRTDNKTSVRHDIRFYQRPASHLGFLAYSQMVFVHSQECLYPQYCSLCDLAGHQLDLTGRSASVRDRGKRLYWRYPHMPQHSVSFQFFDQVQCLQRHPPMAETLLCYPSEVGRPTTGLLQLVLQTDIHRSLQRIGLAPTLARSRVTGSAVVDAQCSKIDGSGLAWVSVLVVVGLSSVAVTRAKWDLTTFAARMCFVAPGVRPTKTETLCAC